MSIRWWFPLGGRVLSGDGGGEIERGEPFAGVAEGLVDVARLELADGFRRIRCGKPGSTWPGPAR